MANKKTNIDGYYIALKDKIFKCKNVKLGITRFKDYWNKDDISKYIYRLNNEKIYSRYISGIPFPKQLNELGKAPVLYYNEDLERELFWYANIFRLYIKEINQFLIQQKKYNERLMVGDYAGAGIILNEIEKEYGFSLWLIENRITLIEVQEGLEKQKEYTNQITMDDDNELFVRFLSSYYSIRAEKNLSSNRFNYIIQLLYQDYSKEYWVNYLVFKLNFFGEHDIDSVVDILHLERTNSIIDRYLTFIRICQYICVKKPSENNLNSIRNALSILNTKINDVSLDNLCYFLGINCNIAKDEVSNNVLLAMDYYTIGEYERCMDACKAIFNQHPCIIEIYEIYVKSAARTSKTLEIDKMDSYLNRILLCMFNVVTKNSHANESCFDILKVIAVNSSSNWAAALLAFLVKEYYHDNKGIVPISIAFGGLNTFLHNPRLARFISNFDIVELYFKNLNKSYEKSETILLQHAINNFDYSILLKILPHERYLKYIADINKSLKMYSDAIISYKCLLEKTDDLLFKQDAICGLVRCYILTDNYNDCFDLIVDTFLQNENMVYKFPLNELVDIIDSGSMESQNNISIPIICDMYSKYISNDKDYVKAIAYEDFLNFSGLEKPSELINYTNDFDLSKLIYFLKHICISQVMDSSISFNSSEEIEKERISVCQILRILDQDNSYEYSDEIKNITKKLMISRGIREIENSKIYVDVEGIKKSVEKNMRESYYRYLSFLSNSIYDDEPDYITVASSEYEGIELKIPSNEKHGLFHAMFFELRDNFVSSNKYGLDGYLSVGIRHGTLSGQLRSPLESSHLITQKDNNTNIYRDNDYWANKIECSDEEANRNAMVLLADFSREIDDLIDLLKNKWIQIKTEGKNPYGLFNFLITLEDLEEIQEKVTIETKYEDFIDMVFQKLWDITEDNLLIIRFEISYNLKMKFNKVFIELQQKLEPLKEKIDLTEMIICINNSRIAIQYELDKISNWFKRVRTTESADYLIKLPIDIALEMIKNIYPNNLIEPQIFIDKELKLKGRTLKSFVDVFYILFDNIIKHSNLNFNNNVKIHISEENAILEVSIQNEVGDVMNINDEIKKLIKIKELIGKDLSMEKVKKEGGTGFYKIDKILSIDLNCKNGIDFEITKDHVFNVYILVDIGGILV